MDGSGRITFDELETAIKTGGGFFCGARETCVSMVFPSTPKLGDLQKFLCVSPRFVSYFSVSSRFFPVRDLFVGVLFYLSDLFKGEDVK